MSTPAVLLTGAGKRYDIVSCFARLTKTIVADPAPLAPAQYAAHVRAAVPLIEDPAYVPALAELCARARRGRRAAADRPRHRGARRARARRGCCPRSCPRRRSRARPTTSTRRTCCWSASALPSPPTVLPEEDLDALDYPVMVKPRRGSGARSIHLAARRRAGALLRRLRAPSRRWCSARWAARSCRSTASATCDGRCLNAIPRTMLESRGGESIKGAGRPRRGADRAGPARDGGAARARSGDDPGVPRPRDRAWRSPT